MDEFAFVPCPACQAGYEAVARLSVQKTELIKQLEEKLKAEDEVIEKAERERDKERELAEQWRRLYSENSYARVAAEDRITELKRELEEAKPVLEAAREQARIGAELAALAISEASVDDPRWAPLEIALEEAMEKTNEAVHAYDADRAAGEDK